MSPTYAFKMGKRTFRILDDVDHILVDPKLRKKPRKTVPSPPGHWNLPKFDPLPLLQHQSHGEANVPSRIDPKDLYAIFDLLFTEKMLKNLADNTNFSADSHQPPAGDDTRKWRPTTVEEMRAYLATYLYIGLHSKDSIGDY